MASPLGEGGEEEGEDGLQEVVGMALITAAAPEVVVVVGGVTMGHHHSNGINPAPPLTSNRALP